MSKLISILIPVYNNEEFLKFSLKSAVQQTYKNIEILIINDGSKNLNKIKGIINSFKDCRINLYSFNKNQGISNALNYGIKKSKGKYISWLSHDDWYHTTKIEKQFNDAIKFNYKIVYSNFYLVENNKIKKINSKISSSFNDQYKDLIIKDVINGCSLLIHRDVFKEIGEFSNKYKHIQDYDMWIRISKKFYFHHNNDYLIYSRVHKNQNSILFNSDARKEKRDFYIFFIKKFFNKKYKDIDLIYKIKLIFSLSKRQYIYFNEIRILLRNPNIGNFFYKFLFIFVYFIGFFPFIIKKIIKKFN